MASIQFAKVRRPTDRQGKNSAGSYWQQLARSYCSVGSPLRPSGEVVSYLENAIARLAVRQPGARLRALLLGVTPSIAEMAWPEGTLLTAADNSLDMVRGVWPGNATGSREAVCANWQSLPLRPRSCDVLIGDGAMNCVRFPVQFQELAKNIHTVLHERGVALLRCYIRPTPSEKPDDVFRDAARGAIPTFHQFKFRLLMAMQRTADEGVAVDAVYRMWATRSKEVGNVFERDGWTRQDIATIDLYRGRNTVHTFPTLAEIRSMLADYYEELEIANPPYPLSEYCPILVLKPR